LGLLLQLLCIVAISMNHVVLQVSLRLLVLLFFSLHVLLLLPLLLLTR
jgi:hypothetical protein